LEEPSGAVSVAAGGDEHVDDLPVLVNRPVHVAPDALVDLLAALTTPAQEQVMLRVPWPDDFAHRGGLAMWLAGLLAQTPHTLVRLTATLTGSPDPGTAISALHAAHRIANERRSPTGQVVDLLTERLDHPDPQVHRTALQLLAACGVLPPAIADRLTPFVDGHRQDFKIEVEKPRPCSTGYCTGPRSSESTARRTGSALTRATPRPCARRWPPVPADTRPSPVCQATPSAPP
jgi:hypothetical protein